MKLFQAYDGANSARFVLAETKEEALFLVQQFEDLRYPDVEATWDVWEVPMVTDRVSSQLDNHGDQAYFYAGL